VINNIEERWNEATEAWVLRAVTEMRAKKEANNYSKLMRDGTQRVASDRLT
jgi:hypothetical protein